MRTHNTLGSAYENVLLTTTTSCRRGDSSSAETRPASGPTLTALLPVPGGRTGSRDRLRAPGRSAAFQTSALGISRDGAGPGRCQSLRPADGMGAEILLQLVPDGKARKNRVHLDLRTRELEPELRRLLSLGATLLTDQPASEAGWRCYIRPTRTTTSSAYCSRRIHTGRTRGNDTRNAANKCVDGRGRARIGMQATPGVEPRIPGRRNRDPAAGRK
jgi:hypothetical protein